MKAELVVEKGIDEYLTIKIEDILNINGKPSIILRTSICEYSNSIAMFNIFNEIVDRINRGEINDR